MHNEVDGDVHGPVVQAGHVDRIDLHAAPAPMTALSGLPPATAVFCGRETELAVLRSCWAEEGPAVVSSAVAGLAGIGKTELVLHAAHQAIAADEFPGGVLFVDLQGYDDTRRVAPAQALDGFLRALGVDSHHIPPAEDQRAVLYRSMLSGRPRMLVVLDNASSAAQVRPLLPCSRHRVVITSRHTLSGLDEARHLDLGLLGEAEAVELVGDAGLAALCGRLPLALRIMRALTTTDPRTEWVDELADAGHRLELLDDGDSRAVHAAFALSYRSLDDGLRRLFRLLSLHPTDEFALEGAAALAGKSVPRTRTLLRELVRAHLIEPGSDTGWYTFHDLVRLYAHRCGADDPETGAALDRMIGHYAIKAHAAHTFISPRLTDDRTFFSDYAEAVSWLHRGWRVLAGAARTAAARGLNEQLYLLAGGLCAYFNTYRHPDEMRDICLLVLASARAAGDRLTEVKMMTELGNSHVRVRRYEEAVTQLESALALNRTIDDDFTLAVTLNDLGTAYRKVARLDDATTAYLESLHIRKAIDDRYGIAQTFNNLGNTARDLGDTAAASEWYDKAFALREEIGDKPGEAQTHNNLATNLMLAGHYDEAVRRYTVALRLHRELGHQFREAGTLYFIGKAMRITGRSDLAEIAWDGAAAICERLGAEDEAREARDLIAELRNET